MDWRDYFSGPTLEQQAWDETRSDYLSKALGLPPGTDLEPEDWLEHIRLAQMNNDLSALAGTERSAPGVGYMYESPESAQQNRLRYGWEDEWAKRLSTPTYDPRYAQRATSFAPNQFSPTANVYVDPFMQQGPRGGLREQVRSPGVPERVNPLLGTPYTYRGTEQLAGRTIQPSPMPQMPAGMDQAGMAKYFGQMEKEEKAQRAAIQKERVAAYKKEQAKLAKIEDDWHNIQYKFRQRERYIRDEKGNMTEAGRVALYNDLAEWAQHYQPRDYKEFAEISGLDPTSPVAKREYARKLRLIGDPEYRQLIEKQQRVKEQAKREKEEAVQKIKKQQEERRKRSQEIAKRGGRPSALAAMIKPPRYEQPIPGVPYVPPEFRNPLFGYRP